MKKHLLIVALFSAATAMAQLTLPPNGGNQKCVVTQYMGLAHISITYNSPDVTGPNGQSREGAIWGKLVPYEMTNFNFGLSSSENPSPWRAGANENTIIELSHDMVIEDKPLKAGIYGLHMIPGEEEWTLIFSNNSTAWGSFFYNPDEDALRVTVKPEENEFTEWLTYTFENKQVDECIAVLEWENLKVPFKVAVPALNDIYVDHIEKELQGVAGFGYQNYVNAANFALTNNIAMEKAEKWADMAIQPPFGQKNFVTLSTKANVLLNNGKTEEAMPLMEEAIKDPSANVFRIHQMGRSLISQGNIKEALMIFKWNAERFPDTWPVNVGLARGYSANGEYKKALKHAEMALTKAPDQLNKDSLTAAVEKLKKNEDIN